MTKEPQKKSTQKSGTKVPYRANNAGNTTNIQPNWQNSGSINRKEFVSDWHAQRAFAETKLSKAPSTGDPNSAFNLRVDEKARIQEQIAKRQRPHYPDGRPYSSTRISALQGSRGATR